MFILAKAFRGFLAIKKEYIFVAMIPSLIICNGK